jgi:putative acyl-CoA dehydrogenase
MSDDPVFAFEDAPNQSPPFVDRNLFLEDRALREGLFNAGAEGDQATLADLGALYGGAETMELGRLANEFPPRLRLVDARGNRLDKVEFHPAYHALMARSMAAGLHCSAWDRARAPARHSSGHAARAGLLFMATQAESGHICPLTMTNASVAALRSEPAIAEKWLPKILGRVYETLVGKERRDARHGHDRASGRHRRARQYDARRSRAGRL